MSRWSRIWRRRRGAAAWDASVVGPRGGDARVMLKDWRRVSIGDMRWKERLGAVEAEVVTGGGPRGVLKRRRRERDEEEERVEEEEGKGLIMDSGLMLGLAGFTGVHWGASSFCSTAEGKTPVLHAGVAREATVFRPAPGGIPLALGISRSSDSLPGSRGRKV